MHLLMKSQAKFFALLSLLLIGSLPAAEPRRVVVVVWDGMRRDFITPETTPQLWALAQSGVFFANHHPVYPSSTEVNGVALATGAYPGRSRIVGNKEYRAGIDAQKSVATENPEVIARGDALSGGHYLALETLAEYLQAKGQRTVIAGAKQVALLHDRRAHARGDAAPVSPVLFEGVARPTNLEKDLAAALGVFPPAGEGNKLARDAWTTRALLEVLWRDGVPPYSLLWLSEPDFSQHNSAPGSPAALTAITSSDTHLGEVLADLDRRGLRANTDVFVVSDHGFSTIAATVDVAVELSKAGFDAARILPGGLQPGKILVVGNGGSVFLYVAGHDVALTAKLIAWVQAQAWAGVLFARSEIEGTFPLALAHLDSPEAPDLVVAMRTLSGKNNYGTPGLIVSESTERGPGQGNHTSLAATDMANTLVAAGPDFRAGVRNPLASANTDLAPTILWLLGHRDEAARRDGRVLSEALNATDAPALRGVNAQRFNARRELPGGVWSQYLQTVEINGVRYLDEGNGNFAPTIK
jgi:arylsulfatase A-like enzyme